MSPRPVRRRGPRLALGSMLAALATVAVPNEAARPEPAACEMMTTAALHARLAGMARYEFAGERILPYLALWRARGSASLPRLPDRVSVIAARGRPLLLAYHRDGCLIGLMPAPAEEVWTALRRMIGPVA